MPLLTDADCKNAKPKDKPYKIGDSGGLYLEVAPSGGKWWRLKYRIQAKEKRLSLGVYPEVSLKEAREKRDATKKLIAQGIDPSEHRKATKQHQQALTENSFEAIAREWWAKFKSGWSDTHALHVITSLEQNVFPWLGSKPIKDIKAADLLAVLRRLEDRGVAETAHRTKQRCGQVFRYAIATSRAEHDIASYLKGALQPINAKHHAAIVEPKRVAQLMRDIDDYSGTFVVKCALKLSPLVFLRPGEIRQAQWKDIDLEQAVWRIPAAVMKMKTAHIVPLSTQAIQILQEIQPLTGNSPYVFPSLRSRDKPMSENAIRVALRNLGYTNEEMTAHGFRTTASTLLNEQGWHPDAIERQLAHAERNKVRAAYNHAEHLPERKRMMQAWADYLDELKIGAKIIPFKAAG